MKTKPTTEQWLDSLDTDTLESRDAVHFRRILAIQETITNAEEELIEAVKAAREAGDSWTIIGAALGISRQAAQQRFG